MLIWKGHGILIPVFGVLGALVASVPYFMLAAITQVGFLINMGPAVACFGAAVGIWIYGAFIGKTTEQTLLDPQTGQPVIYRRSHTFWFIPPLPWAILAALLGMFMAVMGVFMPTTGSGSKTASGGEKLFEAADDMIRSDKGKEAFGNNTKARALAADFAKQVQLLRDMGIEKGKKSTVSFSNGKFLTYCQLNADSCAFMVHVPQLRKFSDDAKNFMGTAAWSAAVNCASTLDPKPKKIAVGVRGAILYDRVLIGRPVMDDDGENPEAGIDERFVGGSPDERLHPFFEPPPARKPAAKPAATAMATGTAAEGEKGTPSATTTTPAPGSESSPGPSDAAGNGKEKEREKPAETPPSPPAETKP